MTETMDLVLELEDVAKTYRPGFFRRPVPALRGLSLRLPRGEIYGLVGPNGAGKSTAFKIILGLLRPGSGRGTLLGRPIGNREARRSLGFLPELPAYHPHLSVAEILRFARALSGVEPNSRADATLLEELGLASLADRPVRKLSKGQLQRVGLAQALVHGPDLLILDEPMSGLDPLGRGLVKDRLLKEQEAGTSILLSSHVLSDVEALADTVGILHEGRLLVQGAPQSILSPDAVEVVIEGSGGLPEDLLRGLPEGSTRTGDCDAWTVRLVRPEGRQVDACLRRMLQGGGRIRGVETRREDLERFFIRRMGEERASCRA